MRISNRWRSPLAGLLLLSLVAAACGGDDSDDTGSEPTTSSGSETTAGGASTDDLSGEVNISGSSTVEPISIRVAELFEEEAPDVVVNVDGPGTGDGFQLFCAGETDISDASRAISDEEIADCEASGIEYVELEVAIDGMAVVTSPQTSGLPECMSFADLYAIAGPEAEGVDNWSGFQPVATELGSTTQFPDAPFSMTAPGAESGTYDSFIEIALEGVGETRVEVGKITEDAAASTRKDYTASADDNLIVQNIEGTANSFGWVGYAYFAEQGDRLTAFQVSEEPGGACVEPTPVTIAGGEYPLSRSLYIYVSKTALEDNPAVGAYVDFYVGDGIAAADEVGYVALAEDDLQATRDAWEQGKG